MNEDTCNRFSVIYILTNPISEVKLKYISIKGTISCSSKIFQKKSKIQIQLDVCSTNFNL